MIQKNLHTIWFGKPVSQMSDLNRRCLESIVDKLPDYQFSIWSDVHGNKVPWVKRAIEDGNLCAASNYFRIWKLFHEGGVYVDTDVEILSPFDLTPACFIGFQRQDTEDNCINTAVMGCEKGHWFAGHLLGLFDRIEPCDAHLSLACTIPTEELFKLGMKGLNQTQMVQDVKIFSRDYFHPLDWQDRKANHDTENTVCIHHFYGSWADDGNTETR